jgi:hypothetical protein
MPIGTPSTVALGWQSTVQINSIIFGVKSGKVREMVDSHECGDTSNGSFKVQKGGRYQFESNFEFYEKDDIEIHDANTLNINPGSYISLKVFPKGLGVTGDPYWSDYFLVENCEVSFDVDGKVQGTLSGKSSGPYRSPDE